MSVRRPFIRPHHQFPRATSPTRIALLMCPHSPFESMCQSARVSSRLFWGASAVLALLPDACCGRRAALPPLRFRSCLLPIEEGRELNTGGAELGGEGLHLTSASPAKLMPCSRSCVK